MASTNDSLTNQTYWEDVWRVKDAGLWTDLAWVQHQYQWFAWDRILRQRLKPVPGQRLLEVGCGGGKWLLYFHKTFGYAITGCDYSEAGCAMTRRNLSAAGVEGNILQQDFYTLSGHFNVIYSHGLIEHFSDPKPVLAQFASLLSSHGVLISLVPNLTGLSGAYHRLLKRETFATHRAIRLGELKKWYEEIGLHHIEAGALGSIVPFRFPRDKLRKHYPRFYRFFWGGLLRPLTGVSNRACIWLAKRWGIRLESPRFSPYLYVIGERG
jgi:2-polyprenyl-6-hydroxyphenyl methylase/3-demethylubiquinone-9 3-methyltransferase